LPLCAKTNKNTIGNSSKTTINVLVTNKLGTLNNVNAKPANAPPM
jgi:hypothetical protein